jgi:membrane associated rhomboid family serine protease
VLPLSDENPRSILPVVTWCLIATNVLVFLWEVYMPLPLTLIIYRYGFVPALGVNLRVITSMFIHIDVTHLAGNMLYLWVFGDNVEDACGHFPFLIFYLLSGFAGSLTMILIEPFSRVPAVGASGAVSGVLGGYMLLFPRTRIRTVLFSLGFINLVRVPAFILIGLWFLLQLLYGLAGVVTGVAYWAHIGGFVAGLLLVRAFAMRWRRGYAY